MKSAPKTRWLSVETQALIWNFLICNGDMIIDQLGLFLFSKTCKLSSTSTKEEKYTFTRKILYLTMRLKFVSKQPPCET